MDDKDGSRRRATKGQSKSVPPSLVATAASTLSPSASGTEEDASPVNTANHRCCSANRRRISHGRLEPSLERSATWCFCWCCTPVSSEYLTTQNHSGISSFSGHAFTVVNVASRNKRILDRSETLSRFYISEEEGELQTGSSMRYSALKACNKSK